MGLFDFRKRKNDIVDLSNEKNIRKVKNNAEISKGLHDAGSYVNIPDEKNEDGGQGNNMFSLFGNIGSKNQDESVQPQESASQNSEDRRRKLAKRLSNMTDQIENISNQIYHLQQRVEALERRMR